MSNHLHWGILGTGNIAKKFAAALAESTTGHLVAVGSRQQSSADDFGRQFNLTRCHGSYEALMADPQVQAIYISLPNHLHAQWAIACAKAGKHILLEKPFATNYAELMPVLDAAREHDVFLMEAFMYRCHPQTAKLYELIRSGVIGEVRLIQTHFGYNMGPRFDNIRLQNSAAGGAIMDVGCYCVSLARLIAGAALGQPVAEPIRIKGVACVGSTSRVDEYATAVLEFPGNILANVSTGNEVSLDSTARIWGSQGHILVPNPWFPQATGNKIIVNRAGQDSEEVIVDGGAGLYTIEADVVARSIAHRQAPHPCMTWDDSVGNQRVLDSWRQEVSLVFDREKPESLTRPVSGQPLTVRENHKMRYGRVEGVDKPVSRLVMGSMVMGTHRLPYSYALLDHFYELGGNCIDTAYVYGGGEAEKAVGRWINQRGMREQIVLIGKGAHTPMCTPDGINRQLDETFNRLGLDYLDIYMLHRDNLDLPVSTFIDCLNQHRKAGRIRAFGGSNWSVERIAQANEYARQAGLTGFTVSSPNFALAIWNEPMWPGCTTATDAQSRAFYQQTQLPLFAWSSQASGFFTGRYKPADRDNPAMREIVRTWFNDGNFERLARAQELARRKGVTTTQIALAYVLCQPLNIYALIGTQSLEETRTSAQALTVMLSEEELSYLEGAAVTV